MSPWYPCGCCNPFECTLTSCVKYNSNPPLTDTLFNGSVRVTLSSSRMDGFCDTDILTFSLLVENISSTVLDGSFTTGVIQFGAELDFDEEIASFSPAPPFTVNSYAPRTPDSIVDGSFGSNLFGWYGDTIAQGNSELFSVELTIDMSYDSIDANKSGVTLRGLWFQNISTVIRSAGSRIDYDTCDS